MQDQEETCPCGYSLDECACRRKAKPIVWEEIDPYERLDGLEQFPEWLAALIDCLYGTETSKPCRQGSPSAQPKLSDIGDTARKPANSWRCRPSVIDGPVSSS